MQFNSLSPILIMWLELACVTLPVMILCHVARHWDVRAMTRMFYVLEEVTISIPDTCASGCPSSSDAPTHLSIHEQIRRPRWHIFRAFNWLISSIFLFSLFYCVSSYTSHTPTSTTTITRLPFYICALTLAYLIGFFGVYHVFQDVEEEEKRQAKKETVTIEYETEPPSPSTTPSTSKSPSPSTSRPTTPTQMTLDTAQPWMIPNEHISGHGDRLCMLSIISPLVVVLMSKCVVSRIHIHIYTWICEMWMNAITFFTSALVVAFFMGVLVCAILVRMLSSTPSSSMKPQDISRHMRRAASYCPPYPNGWYKVCDSWSLKPGDVQSVSMLGMELVVYRGNDKEKRAYVMDAYCPHMGAHLGEGGTVKGSCLECPFHKWQFKGEDGQCSHIPYSDKIPLQAKTKAWPTCEHLNVICMYYDAEGRDPPYMPPSPDALDDMVYRGSYDSRDIHMHLQEFAENSADFQHFDPLHGQLRIPFTTIPIPGITIQHKADWIPSKDDEKHIATFLDTAYLKFFGHHFPSTKANASITFVGPGGIVYFRFVIPNVGNIFMIQSHTPLNPMCQKTQFRWYAEPHIPRLLVWYVIGNWISQWQNDIRVWENKIYSKKPVLAKGDGPITAMRRWYQQFYSESSAKQSHVLEW